MGADKIAKRYRGEGARNYEAKRAGKGKWQREHEAVAQLLPADAKTVLDVPVGTGRFIPLYRERGMTGVGIDTSPDMLEEARKRGLLDLRVGDIRNLPFVADTFDVAVCVRLLGWFEPDEVRVALQELARVAKTVIVSIRTKTGEPFCKNGSLWIHSQEDFAGAVFDAGLCFAGSITFGDRGYAVVKLERQ